MGAVRDGIEIMAALDEAAKAVQAGSTELSKLIAKFREGYVDENGELHEGLKLRYEVAIDEELVRIFEESVTKGQRPPAEDVRGALARSAVRSKHPTLWADYNHVETRIHALRLWLSNQKAVISGYQSLRRADA